MTTINDGSQDTTNAGPVLPDWRKFMSEPPLAIAGDLDQRWVAIQYGRQCWNACAEHVAGPLRQALSECAKAVGAGAAPDCSVEFLREVPREVGLVVAKLRERVAELEAQNKLLSDDLDATETERQRLRAEKARLIEDRARFPDRPDDVGNMIGAHIGNLKDKANAAEDAYRRVQLSLDRLRAESVIEWEPGRSYTAAELLRRAIRGIRGRNGRSICPAVENLFGCGNTVARYLCRWAGRDPDTGKEIADRKGEGSEG